MTVRFLSNNGSLELRESSSNPVVIKLEINRIGM